MFRNLPAIRWEFRIHEQILGALRRAGGEVAWTDLYVVHAGSDQTPEGRRRKLARDYRLLELELRDRPEHPFALFNLGMTHHDCHRYEEACDVFDRARKAADSGDSHVRKLYALWVSSLLNSGKPNEAWSRCQEGIEIYPEDRELALLEAELLEMAEQLEQAVLAYRRLLEAKPQIYFASVSPDIQNGAAARVGLARVLRRLGRFDEAAELDAPGSAGASGGP
jgi:tetratricopeptide (TPR) repeat protein